MRLYQAQVPSTGQGMHGYCSSHRLNSTHQPSVLVHDIADLVDNLRGKKGLYVQLQNANDDASYRLRGTFDSEVYCATRHLICSDVPRLAANSRSR